MKISAVLASPVIILPFKHDGNLKNEAWVLRLGDLIVNTNEKILVPNLPPEMKNLDMYDISLREIKMSHFISLEAYNNFAKEELNNKI